MPARRWFMRIHGWVALIAGVQMLLWVVSGLVMTWFPIDTVRGRHLVRETAPRLINPAEPLAPLGAVIAQVEGGATQATLRFLLDVPVLEIQRTDGSIVLADARTGSLLPPLDEAQARAVAEADFAGAGTIADAVLLDHPMPEDRTAAPVWRVQFDDPDATRVFVSPQTGRWSRGARRRGGSTISSGCCTSWITASGRISTIRSSSSSRRSPPSSHSRGYRFCGGR